MENWALWLRVWLGIAEWFRFLGSMQPELGHTSRLCMKYMQHLYSAESFTFLFHFCHISLLHCFLTFRYLAALEFCHYTVLFHHCILELNYATCTHCFRSKMYWHILIYVCKLVQEWLKNYFTISINIYEVLSVSIE